MEKIGTYWHKIVTKFRIKCHDMLFYTSKNPQPGADDLGKKSNNLRHSPILWGVYFVLRLYLQFRVFPILKIIFGF